MTSDAKIGLLLGLVFIFVIAFIINGLPKLRGQADSNELTEIMATNDSAGIGEAQRAVEPAVVIEPEAFSSAADGRAKPLFDPAGNLSQDDGTVRDIGPLPSYNPIGPAGAGADTTLGQDHKPVIGPPDPQTDRTGFARLITPRNEPTLEERMNSILRQRTTAGGPAERSTGFKPVKIEPPKKTLGRNGGGGATDRASPTMPKNSSSARAKKYKVVAGDTLSSIAKKFYGPEQGNKIANVNRIFEANRKILQSADAVFVGQELTIPPLPATPAPGNASLTGSGLGSKSLFEAVKSVGQRHSSASEAAKGAGRFYTVKEGDCLWTIAASQLGSGARYKEISKLNSAILASEDDIRVGMRLRLPQK